MLIPYDCCLQILRRRKCRILGIYFWQKIDELFLLHTLMYSPASVQAKQMFGGKSDILYSHSSSHLQRVRKNKTYRLAVVSMPPKLCRWKVKRYFYLFLSKPSCIIILSKINQGFETENLIQKCNLSHHFLLICSTKN